MVLRLLIIVPYYFFSSLTPNIVCLGSSSICGVGTSFGKNFTLGIGIGDNKYEIQKDIYDNNIEEVIKKIIANKNYQENNVNLVIGGSSQKLNALALKYGLGTNQWEGDIINLLKKIEVHSKAKSKELNVSYCTKDLTFDGKTISQDNFEIIYVLSEKKSFNKQIDEIEKQCLN